MPKPFAPGNKETAKRERAGRPKRMTTTIADVCSAAELKKLLRDTYVRAMNAEPTSLLWLLNQMPKLDSGFKLPKGLPPLTSLRGCVAAIDAIGEMARLGKVTVAECEKALAVINALAHARVSLLARASEKLDAELRAAIEQERRLEQAPALPVPAWSPGGESLN